MQGIRYEREEKGAAGRKMFFHCVSCCSFVRSAEQERGKILSLFSRPNPG
jgi:hypothetical protein